MENVCHSTFFIFTFALKVVGLCRHRHRRRHRHRHRRLLRHRTNNIWHTRSARSARSVITLAEVVETPVVVSTATLVTGVAVGLVYSCVDHPSTLAIAITASVLIAASLSQGSKGKEKETQAEKLGSLHVWFDQMCLRWSVLSKWRDESAGYLFIPEILPLPKNLVSPRFGITPPRNCEAQASGLHNWKTRWGPLM